MRAWDEVLQCGRDSQHVCPERSARQRPWCKQRVMGKAVALDHKQTDRRRGAILGLAIGDALGAAVKFQPAGSFPEVTGFRAGEPHGLEPGEWTDDTSMALALAESIADVGWDVSDQARRYVSVTTPTRRAPSAASLPVPGLVSRESRPNGGTISPGKTRSSRSCND